MSVTFSAPGKLMLAGSYAVVHGRPCVVTAVDQRLEVTVEKNGDDRYHIEAPDLGLSAYTRRLDELGTKDLPKSVRFTETLYKIFLEKYPQQEGIIITTRSHFSSQFGFGSSSAVTVAFAAALAELYGVTLSQHQLFELCYEAVLQVQGVGSGFDIAAAIWGGTILYEKPARVVESLQHQPLPIMVVYTGYKADTPTLVRMVNAHLESDRNRVEAIFDRIGVLSEALAKAIQSNDWEFAGKLAWHHQSEVARLGVSTPAIDGILQAARDQGAWGGTLSGAGGGDCVILYADSAKHEQITAAVTELGATVLPVELQAPGVRKEEYA